MSMISSLSGFSMKEQISKEDNYDNEITNSEIENENDNFDSSLADSFKEMSEINDKTKTNEDLEISEFMKNSMINEYEYDFDISNNDDDLDVDTEFLKDITRELGKSEINLSNDESEESDEDENVKRRVTRENDITNCHYNLKRKEPEFEIDINKGFTQMVDEKIKKVTDAPYYTNNQMIEVLMIAEKPSLAKIIAHILSRGNILENYSDNGLTIYTYEGRFKGKKAFFTVSSIRGHVYQDSFKKEVNENYYNDEDINIRELYEEKIVKNLKKNFDEDTNKFINVPQFLRNIAKGKDILCLWLDCDPEVKTFVMKLFIMFFLI